MDTKHSFVLDVVLGMELQSHSICVLENKTIFQSTYTISLRMYTCLKKTEVYGASDLLFVCLLLPVIIVIRSISIAILTSEILLPVLHGICSSTFTRPDEDSFVVSNSLTPSVTLQ